MTARTGPPSPPWRQPWVLAIAIGVAVALVLVLLLQFQQLARLRSSLASGHDLRTVQLHRQETEYLQLREQWTRALDASQPLDLRALALRYDIWVGRVAMLGHDTPARRIMLSVSPDLDRTLKAVDSFVTRADAVVNGDAPDAPRRQALASLWPELAALGEPMHELALASSHQAAGELTARSQLMATYARITLALTGSMALLVVAFGVLSLRQLRLLQRREASLHTLTAELDLARSAAEAQSRAKSHYLADMSHEIRTPFQGLLGTLALLRDTPLDTRQLDYLRTASESADHVLAVLNDILDMSQLEAGRLDLNPLPTHLRDLLHEVETLMRPQATGRGITLHVDASPALPERAWLDGTRVKQVLINLLGNAIKYSRRGTVELLVGTRSGQGGLPLLVFTVVDSGPGMDDATLRRLFTRFERAAAGPDAAGGNGLGLDISRSLARLMSGDVQAQSEPGRGSRFEFSLPLKPVSEASALPAAAAADEQAPTVDVLVAEDHPINRQVLGALLERLGHRAHFVGDGEAAVQAVQQQRFDLVLMDLHMPSLDGIEATRLIRALPDRNAATVPIVALTADAFTDTRDRCLLVGMNGFLTKPVSVERLAALLRQLFGTAAGADGDLTGSTPASEPAEPSASAPLIDPQAVTRTLELLQADQYRSLLAGYLDQAPDTVSRLRQAVRDAQPMELRLHAHATRGAALNLGLAALAATAGSLQDGAAHLPAHEIARLVQRFETQVDATREAAAQAGLLPAAAPAANDAVRR